MDTDRYEEVQPADYTLLTKVREEKFAFLNDANIKILLDTKKKISEKKLVLAKIHKPNELVKHFVEEGVNYIIIADKVVWDVAPEMDKIRLFRHELRHAYISATGGFDLVGHDFEDFYEEAKLNSDDPDWKRRIATLAEDIYTQREEQAKAAKKSGRKPGRPRKEESKSAEQSAQEKMFT
jgi:hypothetical protein